MKQLEGAEEGGSQARLWSKQLVTCPAQFPLSLNPFCNHSQISQAVSTAYQRLSRRDLNNPSQGNVKALQCYRSLGVLRYISTEDKILSQMHGITGVNKFSGRG